MLKKLDFLPFLSFFILAIFFLSSSVCRAAELQNVRLGTQSATTVRLVLDLSDKPQYSTFLLKEPYRVVVDVKNTSVKVGSKTLKTTGKFITALRIGKIGTNDARVVAQTSSEAKINKSFFLPPQGGFGWRLVVDIEKVSVRGKIDTLKNDNLVSDNELKSTVKPLIMIDPGHGGKDPGAISVSGFYEKNLTLRMAKEVQSKLLATGRYRVQLTRSDDRALALRQRVQIARNAKTDIFISIHADSAKNKNAKGLSVYTLSEKASDKEAAALAEAENKADAFINMDFSDKTPEVANILLDLARRDTMNTSKVLAEAVVKEFSKTVRVLPDTHRFAGFAVLKAQDIPSILIELGYLSNKEEEALLRTPQYRTKLAIALTRAIDRFFEHTSILEE